MSVETLPGFATTNLLETPIYEERQSAQVVEPVKEFDINYAERAATVEYHSRLYLIPHNLTLQYGDYLAQKGYSPKQIEEKLVYVHQFFKDRESILDKGIPEQDSIMGEEEELLLSMYNQSVASVRQSTIDTIETFAEPDGRIGAGDIFVTNILKYTNEQRIQILQDLGYKKEDAAKIAIGLGTAVISTIALQSLEGPAADIIATYLARVDGVQEISNQIAQLEPVVKWLATATVILGSATSHYLTSYAKTLQTLRAIKEECYAVPNAIVASDAIISNKMVDPKENNFKLHWRLFKKHMMSPWVLWDEKWNLTLLIPDFGVTYATGNTISSGLNVAQIVFMEANIQFCRLQKRAEQRYKDGYTLSLNEKEEIQQAYEIVLAKGHELSHQFELSSDPMQQGGGYNPTFIDASNSLYKMT